jgi:hypothetical protein
MRKSLFVVFFVVLFTVFCGTSPKSDICQKASPQQFERINSGIQSFDNRYHIKEAYAIKAEEHNDWYYVAAMVYGPDVGDGVMGVWAISGTPDNPGISLSLGAVTSLFTRYPEADTTKFAISYTDRGAYEAKSCAR